jgi:hypothetical protein
VPRKYSRQSLYSEYAKQYQHSSVLKQHGFITAKTAINTRPFTTYRVTGDRISFSIRLPHEDRLFPPEMKHL